MNVGGIPRSLMWRDLRAVSRELAEELAPAAELWLVINKGADPVKITLYILKVVSSEPHDRDDS